MNFLILNWKDIRNPEVGGAEVIAFEFARRLVKEGHSVTFFARSFPGAKRTESIDGVVIERRGGKLSVYLQAFLFYRKNGKRFDKVIDMVNTLCWQTPLYIEGSKRYAYVNQLAQEVLYYELPRPISWICYLLEKFQYLPYLNNTKFIVYSESTKQDLISYGVKPPNIHMFPMGLDHTRYVPKKPKSKSPLLLFVARLVKMKRPELCIRAMQYILNDFPETKLVIVGNGPDEERLRLIVKKMNLEKSIEFITKKNFFINKKVDDPKVDLMQKSWALLLPSVKEGWGMVVTEAAACGTPAIVTDVTGLRDSVMDGKSGIIVPSNPSPEEYAEAILTILHDKSLRDRLSEGAIAWSKRFDWDKSFNGFKKIVVG